MYSGKATTGERKWEDLMESPGDEVIRLCSVRVKTEDGRVTETVDIREPVCIEIEYEVLQSGHQLLIYYHVIHENGVEAFTTIESDPLWRKKPRGKGRYVSAAWIPGNFLSEGMYFIGPGIRTMNPDIRRFRVDDAVGFQVIDSMDGNSARIDYTGNMAGVVRPLLKWETGLMPSGNFITAEHLTGEANA